MIDVSNQNPLIRRAFMALEDGNWAEADKHCEEALNQEPENAYAYLGKLLAKLYCHNARELLERETPLTGDPLFEKILCFGTQDLRDKLNWIDQGIAARIEERRRVQAQEEEQQRIQEEEAAAERKKRVIRWLKRLAPIVAVWIFVAQVLIPFFHYTSIEKAKVGEYVRFGKYKGETLTWLVLDVQENKKLLLTEFGIESYGYFRYYLKDHEGWTECKLRRWLNEDFYSTSFNDEEKSRILETTVTTRRLENRHWYDFDTYDRVFCLSRDEIKKYFYGEQNSEIYDGIYCKPTEYAQKRGVLTLGERIKLGFRIHFLETKGFEEYCMWMLRDYKMDYIACADEKGGDYNIYSGGAWNAAIRPALWVEVEQ